MNWEDYSARRRMTLESFLQDSPSEDEAHAKFSRKGIGDYPRDQVSRYYSKISSEQSSNNVSSSTMQDQSIDSSLTEISAAAEDTASKTTKAKSGSVATKN